tara:strand:- start:1461 stop:2261 length:801 start_codon:yes stop_codon:yes gene_type:complete
MSELRVNTIRSNTAGKVTFSQAVEFAGSVDIKPGVDEAFTIETRNSGAALGRKLTLTGSKLTLGPLDGSTYPTSTGFEIQKANGLNAISLSPTGITVDSSVTSIVFGSNTNITFGSAAVGGNFAVDGNCTFGNSNSDSHTINGDLTVTGTISQQQGLSPGFGFHAFGEVEESVSSGTLAGTPTLANGSGGISNVSHNAGTYTVTFATATANTNYSLLISPRDSIVASGLPRATVESIVKSTTGFTFQISNHANATGTIVVAFSVMK